MSEESVGDAGASSLGYFGGCFSPEGRSIVAHGFTGALHLWHREGMASGCPLLGAWCQEGQRCVCGTTLLHQLLQICYLKQLACDTGGRGWVPQHALGGHYGAVVDMQWGADGQCLHTVSEDQTSRIFSALRSHWCEIARPQVWSHNKSALLRSMSTYRACFPRC